jgi:hypothetical protein
MRHQLSILFLVMQFLTVEVRADVGQPCPTFSLKHQYLGIKKEIEKLLPISSFVSSLQVCDGEEDVIVANYSPICEPAPDVSIAVMTAIADSNRELVQFRWYLPYSNQAELYARQLVEGVEREDFSKLPDFVNQAAEGAKKLFVIEAKQEAAYLLVTKQKGLLTQSNQDYLVINLMHKDNYLKKLMKLKSCLK